MSNSNQFEKWGTYNNVISKLAILVGIYKFLSINVRYKRLLKSILDVRKTK